MAPSHLASNVYETTFTTGGTARDLSFNATAGGSNRFMLVHCHWNRAGLHSIDGVTWNGVSLTGFTMLDQAGERTQLWRLTAPATGSYTLQVDPGTGSEEVVAVIVVAVYQDVDQTTPYDNYNSALVTPETDQVSALTITSESGDLAVVFHGAESLTERTGTPTGFTTRQSASNGAGAAWWGTNAGDAAGAASVATSVAWGDTLYRSIAEGLNLNAATGATIALSGTITAATTEADIVAGGKTIVLTATGDTWIAA